MRRAELLDRLAPEHELEDALHCRVARIRRRNLRPEARVEAERNAVPLA